MARSTAGLRPARPIRPLAVLVSLGLALVLIGRTTGSGWTMVIVSGLAGLAVAGMAWPAWLLRRVAVGVGGSVGRNSRSPLRPHHASRRASRSGLGIV